MLLIRDSQNLWFNFIGFEMTNTLKSEIIQNRKNNLNLLKISKTHDYQNINILVIYNNKSLNICI